MKKLTTLVTTILLTVITGCSNLVLKPADFSWPVETVLKVDKNGFVQEKRYNLSFNTKELFYNETGDSLGYQGKELRVIRNTKGYYFMVADNFRNIYIFQPGESSLTLSNKINLSDSVGVSNPAFNLRPPYIELNYDNNKKLYLSNEGKKEEDEK
ncbi:MAG TPA: hypothetical protein VKA26_03365 [Ignavibacteriaceae bacterium]|nr:hypothetical protein [Ignavibacteriaceae bacterium]